MGEVSDAFDRVQARKDEPPPDELLDALSQEVAEKLRAELGTSVGITETTVRGMWWVWMMCRDNGLSFDDVHDVGMKIGTIMVNQAARLLAAQRVTPAQAMEICAGGGLFTGMWVGIEVLRARDGAGDAYHVPREAALKHAVSREAVDAGATLGDLVEVFLTETGTTDRGSRDAG